MIVSGLLVAHSVYAADPKCGDPGVLCYTPLEPITGFTSGMANVDLPTFLEGLFRILFSLGALLAVVMLVIGGIEYMVSEIPGVKNQGLKRAQAALWGMAILAGSYLILNTINPDLLKLDFTVRNNQTTQDTNNIPTFDACSWSTTNSSTPNVQGFSSASSCGSAVIEIAQGVQLLNTKSGNAILVLNTEAASITLFQKEISAFSKECQAVSGVIQSSFMDEGKKTALFCRYPKI
ncbi:MAG: Uncharacterized protein G01um101456_337 [Parcubacteria group bacterium Gr01-1014_56]|nr:MAG: Uncharacterized protein G01um101456_337 [Parcubacteria group bacterium Gr01-1014_56]